MLEYAIKEKQYLKSWLKYIKIHPLVQIAYLIQGFNFKEAGIL
jgi:hypothetical protein